MRPSADVLVIGDALLDIHVSPSERIHPGGDVPAAVRLSAGGQGANVAVRLSRRGVRVRLACAIAEDAAGRIVREALEADDVELDVADAKVTGAVVVLVASDGERTMFSRRVPLLPRAVSAASWTVASGYVLLEDPALDLRGDGRRAVLGCSVPHGDEGRWWLRARELAPDLVVLNADEATALGADVSTLAADCGGLAVVTGPEGAVATYPSREAPARHATVERVTAVDTTGAGDAFAAGLLAELHDRPSWADADVDRALAAGLELAAQVAGVPGAQTAVDLERRAAPA